MSSAVASNSRADRVSGLEIREAWRPAQESSPERAKAGRDLLFLQFLLINICGMSLLGAGYVHGLVGQVFAADATHLTLLISFVFLVGLVLCGARTWDASQELDRIQSPARPAGGRPFRCLERPPAAGLDRRHLPADALRLRLTQRIALIRHIAGSLVILGLIGTVIGFIIALSGVEPGQASDVDAVSPMISTLISGMSTALYTTLVGAILNVWLMANYQLLAGGTARLIAAVLEADRDHD